MTTYYSINSEIVPVAQASLQVNDLAILRGYGVFDFFLVRNGVPLFIEDHLERFQRSADFLGLDLPGTKEELGQEIEKLIAANGLAQSGIRLILTGGYSADGYTPATPNMLIMEHPHKAFDPKVYQEGVKLILHEYTRDTPTTKTTNYLVPIRLIKQIKASGAFDVLYHYQGLVSESSRSNIFLVTAEGEIATPRTDALEGVTRKKVMALARKHFKVSERDISLDELYKGTECFITSTTKGVMPVTRIEEHQIGNGQPGPVARQLGDLLEAFKLDYIQAKKRKAAIR